MDRKNRWDAADSKLTKSFRKVEERYFRKHIKNKVISGTFIFLLGIGLILAVYLEAETKYVGPGGRVDPVSYIAGMSIWSVLFLGDYGYYMYELFRNHQEIMKNSLYCKRVVCVGKEDTRTSSFLDLMAEDGTRLEGLAVPLYVEPDIDLFKPVYLVVADPEAFYEQANIYPSPFQEKNPLDFPETAEILFRK